MLRSMHMTVVEADLPFEPEGGAYGGHVTNDGYSHHHHGHSHAQAHAHAHCGHDHHKGCCG